MNAFISPSQWHLKKSGNDSKSKIAVSWKSRLLHVNLTFITMVSHRIREPMLNPNLLICVFLYVQFIVDSQLYWTLSSPIWTPFYSSSLLIVANLQSSSPTQKRGIIINHCYMNCDMLCELELFSGQAVYMYKFLLHSTDGIETTRDFSFVGRCRKESRYDWPARRWSYCPCQCNELWVEFDGKSCG